MAQLCAMKWGGFLLRTLWSVSWTQSGSSCDRSRGLFFFELVIRNGTILISILILWLNASVFTKVTQWIQLCQLREGPCCTTAVQPCCLLLQLWFEPEVKLKLFSLSLKPRNQVSWKHQRPTTWQNLRLWRQKTRRQSKKKSWRKTECEKK